MFIGGAVTGWTAGRLTRGFAVLAHGSRWLPAALGGRPPREPDICRSGRKCTWVTPPSNSTAFGLLCLGNARQSWQNIKSVAYLGKMPTAGDTR